MSILDDLMGEYGFAVPKAAYDKLQEHIAARQPVGQEPSAWLIHWSHSSFAEPEATTRASRAEAVGMLTDPPRIDPLYAKPSGDAG